MIDDILKDIPIQGKFFVAGGYVRDTALGAPVTDIDIYATCYTITSLLRVKGWSLLPSPSYAFAPIKQIWVNHHTPYPAQLIMLSPNVWEMTPEQFVRRYFDIGLCMCYYSNNTAHFMEEFLRDEADRTLTYYLDKEVDNPFLTMTKRFPKLMDKYPLHEPRIKYVNKEVLR